MTTNGTHYSRKHTITALVQDKPGVLNRVVSMFRRRGFNIASLAVGQSEIANLSRMTFVVNAENEDTVEQATKQLSKIIEVVKVTDLSSEDIVARELALVKVKAPDSAIRGEVIQIVELFRAKIVDVGADTLVVEITGEETKIDTILSLLKVFGIIEIMRTGRVAITRGKKMALKTSVIPAKED